MPDVVIHGPTSWNLIVDLDKLPHPRPHMKFAKGHREVMGGTSAGKAAHLVDLKMDVELHTVLGTDAASRLIQDSLAFAGIRYEASRAEGPSERHLNLMDQNGGRVSIYLDVCNPLTQQSASVARRHLRNAISDARAVVMDLSTPSRDVIEEVAGAAAPIWTDLHDYDGQSDFHAPFLNAASFVFMNDDNLHAPQQFLQSCIARGVRIAVCTLGSDGAMAVDHQGTTYFVPAHPVRKVVDTNGAGDGFMAGFLQAHLTGADVQDAMIAGAEQAARALETVHLHPRLERPTGGSS